MRSLLNIEPDRRIAPSNNKCASTPSSTPSYSCDSCALQKKCAIRNLGKSETQQFEGLITGRRRLIRNASVFRKNEIRDRLYVVRSGQFKLTGEDWTGNRKVLDFYLPGDLMGLDAIAIGRHNYQFIALENSEVCEISLANITNMMSVKSEIQMQFLQIMSESLNSAFTHSFLLAMSLDQRFAAFLLWISEKHASLGYSNLNFRLAMSRSDIGSYIHATGASISRLITKFNTDGAVSIQGRLVEVRDRKYLVGLASRDEDCFLRAA